MSSPLGGYYVNAYNRSKKVEHEQNFKPKYHLEIEVYCDDKSIVDGAVDLIDGQRDDWQNQNGRLGVTATSQPCGLIQLHCRFDGKGQYADDSLAGEQLLNVENNEELSCLFAGNERLKVKLTLVSEAVSTRG